MTADIEAVMVAGLADPHVPVSTQRPDSEPPFIKVTATGGPPVASHVIDRATVAVEITGADEEDAAALAGRTRTRIDALAGSHVAGVWVADATSTRPAWFPDTDGRPRYVLTATLVCQLTDTTTP